MVRECPKCGLINPPEAQRCDCGYDFASRTLQKSYLGTGGRRAFDASGAVLTALAFISLGLVLSRWLAQLVALVLRSAEPDPSGHGAYGALWTFLLGTLTGWLLLLGMALGLAVGIPLLGQRAARGAWAAGAAVVLGLAAMILSQVVRQL